MPETRQRIGCAVCAGLLSLLIGCAGERAPRQDFVTTRETPVASRFLKEVRAEVERQVGTQQAETVKALGEAAASSVSFKQPMIVQTLADPWTGLPAIEQYGWRVLTAAQQGPAFQRELLEALEAGLGRHPVAVAPTPYPASMPVDEHIAYLTAVLEEASRLRTQALVRLSASDRQFVFDHAATLVERFSPQLSGQDGRELFIQAEADRRFLTLAARQVDYSWLIAAAQTIVQLADDQWLQLAQEAFSHASAQSQPVSGISGTVLLVQETTVGLIVIGGPGENNYELDQRIALVLDLGGNDRYHGTIAAPADVAHGISVVIDLGGDDTYEAAPLGLATGRLGVGLLVDRQGSDQYHLAPGTGGAGFAGLGILEDREGDDRYRGARFTQGVAVAGLGLLVDRQGHDQYTSDGFAIGFGGPLGVGAVLDGAGDDEYQCGATYPSRYNETDAPQAKPGDPLFQYDCFGLGAGAGQRIFPGPEQSGMENVAGGIGLVMDLDGHDRYRSANFSQGVGYFFGLGLKLDLAGDDEHLAARYGHGASAHFGVGLFVDRDGADQYSSTGPVYNGGAAWDRSVALCLDAGRGNDVYDLQRSSGLGVADHQSWSLFIEVSGRDRYLVPTGMGQARDGSVSGFVDLDGGDEYRTVPSSSHGARGNARLLRDGAGGLFMDR